MVEVGLRQGLPRALRWGTLYPNPRHCEGAK
jgi:hypothetical protein